MSEGNWPTALAAVLRHEGLWSDHPADPGGATMKGITLATFREARGADRTKEDLRAISDADVSDIYRKRYWNAVRGDQLPAGVDLCVFDLAVNSGPGRAVRLLQKALGVNADGSIGPKTLAAAYDADALTVIGEICDLRLAFLRSLPTWPTFGKGWWARVENVRKEASSLARHPSQE